MAHPTQAVAPPAESARPGSAASGRAVPESSPAEAAYVPASAILAFVAACAAARLFSAWATGFAGDESYTAVIARVLAFSYFDHPPLHQWVLHATEALAGEGWGLKLPFALMTIAINVPLYGLTRRLSGPGAALWTLFAFNAAPYFVLWPDGVILPDTPMFLFLCTATWIVAEILFGPQRSRAGLAGLWLAAGVAFGLAGLSKYSAAFGPLGLAGFLLFSPRHRHWLWNPLPYLGGAAAFAVFSPVLIWNLEQHWVSFTFQSDRIASSLAFGPAAFGQAFEALGGQIALLSPWIGAPLVLALWTALRTPGRDSPRRFQVWLVCVPLALFMLMPFMGRKTLPHWFNSAWLFAFPLLGAWLSEKSAPWLRRWAAASAALAGLIMTAFTAYLALGPFWLAADAKPQRDATEWSYDWRGLKETPAWSEGGAAAPVFAIVENWRMGGKAGLALGPSVPVCAFSKDPRGFAFECDGSTHLGQDALIVVQKEYAATDLAMIGAYFERLGPAYVVAEGRAGRSERFVTVARGYKLLRSYRTPYGLNAWPQSRQGLDAK
jgi:Dolichyl-phosphate-mannose-protein mannosyltransferase